MTDKDKFIFMIAVASICTALLSVSEIVFQRVLAANPVIMRETLQLVNHPLKPDSDVVAIFNQKFRFVKVPSVKGRFIVSKASPTLVLRELEGTGLWGKIRLLSAYDFEAKMLKGMQVLAQNETPGLGARIEEVDFRKQFLNMPVEKEIKAAKVKVLDNEFDGITGATISSNAVASILNETISQIEKAAASKSLEKIEEDK